MAPSTRRIALLALAGLAACGEPQSNTAPPLDRFYYPTGIALTTIPQSGHTGLVVLSSNFDLRYDVANGGTVLVVDVDATLAGAPADRSSPASLVIVGSARVGSFGGQVAVLDPTSCSTWPAPPARNTQILATSRTQDALYTIDMKSDGSAPCDASAPCKVLPLEPSLGDPYDVAVACGQFPEPAGAGYQSADRAYAFITYGQSVDSEGWLSRLDMLGADPSATRKQLDLGVSDPYAAAFDPASARLFVTARVANINFNPLRWFSVATPRRDSELAPLGPSTLDLGPLVRGSDSRGIAISSDGKRAYVAMRMYDVEDATSLGGRPAGDVSGALAVLDLQDLDQGGTPRLLLPLVSLDRGPSEVKVIPRAGQRDLVAVTSSDDSALTLYDDQEGKIVHVFGLCDGSVPNDAGAPPPCAAGKPLLGQQPFGLAVQPVQVDGKALERLFVGSFDRSWVNVIDIDPSQPQLPYLDSRNIRHWWRIGPERQ